MDINTESLDTILRRIEDVAQGLSVQTTSTPKRSGQHVSVVREREGFEVLKELQSVEQLSEKDRGLVKSGYDSGFNDVDLFVRWSAEPQAVVYALCFNRLARKIEGKKGQVSKLESDGWKYTTVTRRHPIEFHYTASDHDAAAEDKVRSILKHDESSPVDRTDVRKFCIGYIMGTMGKIEQAISSQSDLAKSHASLGDVLYSMLERKKL